MFQLPKLPYKLNELAPFMSEEQMRYHYEKHHKAYIDNLNKEVANNTELESQALDDIVLESTGALFNNAAQTWNHAFFWCTMAPKNRGGEPSPELTDAIKAKFGSFNDFFQKFTECGVKQFGSGWVWLCADNSNSLKVISTPNAEVPFRGTTSLRPILMADVWEHAYYVDYRNRRKDFLDAFKDYICWDFVNENFKNKYTRRMNSAVASNDEASTQDQVGEKGQSQQQGSRTA